MLRPADVPSAAAALGVTVPVRIRTAADVEAIHRPWVAAQALELLRVGPNRAVAAAASDGAPSQQWWTAVAAVLRAESHDDHRRGAAVMYRMLLTVLANDPPPATANLEDAVHKLFHGADYEQVDAVYKAFRHSVMPIDAGMDPARRDRRGRRSRPDHSAGSLAA